MQVAQEHKRKELIPCLLYCDLTRPFEMFAVLSISKDEADAQYQYLDLMRLELILEDGRKENLLGYPYLFRLYFGEHEYAQRFFSYRAGRLEYLIEECKMHRSRAYFSSSLWPPAKQATLIAEGALRLNAGEIRPFRQVSVWQFGRDWGIRRIHLE